MPVSSATGRYRFEDGQKDIETEYAVNERRSAGELKRRIKKHLAPFFGSRRMSTTTAADVRTFTFAYLTGWRIQSEILPLQWRHVDLKAGTVRLDPGTTKNRDGRLFPFGDRLPELRDLLEAQRRAQNRHGDGGRQDLPVWVFHRNGRRVMGFRKAWANACEAAECPVA
jgi:integrase